MNVLIPAAADLVAITVLTFALYLPRHRRTDLVPAFLGVNVGVMAVSAALASGTASVGLGLGLFGVLSIIRLRSSEMSHREIAYYFAALALGLLGGIGAADPAVSVAMMALVLAVMAIGDHPRIAGSRRASRQQQVMLDRAVSDPHEVRTVLGALLRAEVLDVQVIRLDLVDDSTLVQVEYLPGRPGATGPADERTPTTSGVLREAALR